MLGLFLSLGTRQAGEAAPDTTARVIDTATISTDGTDLTIGFTEAQSLPVTVDWVAVPNADSNPTATQVRAGQDSAGSAAADSGTFNISASGTATWTAPTGLAAGTYKLVLTATDNAGNNWTSVIATNSWTVAASFTATKQAVQTEAADPLSASYSLLAGERLVFVAGLSEINESTTYNPVITVGGTSGVSLDVDYHPPATRGVPVSGQTTVAASDGTVTLDFDNDRGGTILAWVVSGGGIKLHVEDEWPPEQNAPADVSINVEDGDILAMAALRVNDDNFQEVGTTEDQSVTLGSWARAYLGSATITADETPRTVTAYDRAVSITIGAI